MSGLYTAALVIHLVVAVLGLGSIASIAIVAATARRPGHDTKAVPPWLEPLLRYSVFSLGAMLVTGILLDLAAKGAFRGMWWFRGSALLLLATGAMHGLARRTVRAGEGSSAAGLRRIEQLAYGMCALIVVITVMMKVKPF
jgi:hypothetical protein